MSAADAAFFISEADRIMQVEGRAASIRVDGRQKMVGPAPEAADTPASPGV